MTLGELPPLELRRRLRGPGVRVRIGPFITRVQSALRDVEASLQSLYCRHLIEQGDGGAHFSVRVDAPNWIRRVARRQVQLNVEGREPFIPLPRRMAAPMLEGGLNWCVGNFAHQFVIVHSATLERGGRAVLMPAAPGSGKSTLCAALVHRGWRLLSDEFALVDAATGLVFPCPRPVALKGQSTTLIRGWAPDAWLTAEVDNHEGERVSYMRPPAESVDRGREPATPAWVVVPRYTAGSPAVVEQLSRARTVMHLADNSFNYNHHGRAGFQCLADLADRAPAALLRYSALDDGVRAVDELAGL